MTSLPYNVEIRQYRVWKSKIFVIFGLIDIRTATLIREYALLRRYMALALYLSDLGFKLRDDVTTIWRQNVKMTSQRIFNWFIRFCDPQNHMIDAKIDGIGWIIAEICP